MLVGGTFDPPPRGHIELACAARDASRPAAFLLFVPAARSPHKAAGPAATDTQRIAMLDLAIRGIPNAGVWTDEIDRQTPGEPSYWVQTLERARSLLGGDAPLAFVIGADQAVSLHRWAEPRRILELAEPIVLLRSPVDSVSTLRASLSAQGFWSDAEIDRLVACAADVGTMDVSATEIRGLLKENRENARLESLLPPGVLEFILDRGLYT